MEKVLCPHCQKRLIDATIGFRDNFIVKEFVNSEEIGFQTKCKNCRRTVNYVLKKYK